MCHRENMSRCNVTVGRHVACLPWGRCSYTAFEELQAKMHGPRVYCGYLHYLGGHWSEQDEFKNMNSDIFIKFSRGAFEILDKFWTFWKDCGPFSMPQGSEVQISHKTSKKCLKNIKKSITELSYLATATTRRIIVPHATYQILDLFGLPKFKGGNAPLAPLIKISQMKMCGWVSRFSRILIKEIWRLLSYLKESEVVLANPHYHFTYRVQYKPLSSSVKGSLLLTTKFSVTCQLAQPLFGLTWNDQKMAKLGKGGRSSHSWRFSVRKRSKEFTFMKVFG